jgi:hypothetical protein
MKSFLSLFLLGSFSVLAMEYSDKEHRVANSYLDAYRDCRFEFGEPKTVTFYDYEDLNQKHTITLQKANGILCAVGRELANTHREDKPSRLRDRLKGTEEPNMANESNKYLMQILLHEMFTKGQEEPLCSNRFIAGVSVSEKVRTARHWLAAAWGTQDPEEIKAALNEQQEFKGVGGIPLLKAACSMGRSNS